MKKLAFAVLIAGAVFALSQCELFNTTVEYNVSGGSGLSIMYQNEKGELVSVTAGSPWSTSFELSSSDKPFLAFIRVVNNDLVTNATVYILEDGSTAAGPGTAPNNGGSTEIYAIVY